MAFSLIDEIDGAIPITPLTKKQLPAWLDEAPDHERNWVRAIGFSADPGKHALVPGNAGLFTRVVIGLGDGDDTRRTMWALAGLPGELPEGCYRLETIPEGADPTRLALGWALATYAYSRYSSKTRPDAILAWPEGADRGRVERHPQARRE